MFVPIVANWIAPVTARYQFQTTVMTADDGTEYRAAARSTPRRVIEFTTWPQEQRRVRDYILRRVDTEPFRIADPTQPGIRLTDDLASHEMVARVNVSRYWLKAGAKVALIHRRHAVEATVVDITDEAPEVGFPYELPMDFADTVGLDRRFPFHLPLDMSYPAPDEHLYVILSLPTGRTWPAGETTILPVVKGWFDMAAFSAAVPQVMTGNIQFAVLPGSEPDLPTVFRDYDIWANGREGLLNEPEWSNPVTLDYPMTIEQLDYARGQIEAFDPVTFRGRTLSAVYRCKAPEARDLIEFWYRQKGRRGEFYRPSWTADLTLAEDLEPGFTQLKVAVGGPEVAVQFGDRRTYPAIMVRTRGGQNILCYVTDMEADGGQTVLSVKHTAFPSGLTTQEVDMISWVSLCRFASDDLVVTWTTDGLAEIALPVQEIREISPDPGAYIQAESTLRLLQAYTPEIVEDTMAPLMQQVVNGLYPEATAALWLK